MNIIHVVKLVFFHVGSMSLQTKTRLGNLFKKLLSYCKLQLEFKNTTKLDNAFERLHSKKMLFLPLFISFSVDFAMSAVMVNVFTLKFNPFSTSVSLLYPLKTSENRRFSTVFRRWRKCALETNSKNKLRSFVNLQPFDIPW